MVKKNTSNKTEKTSSNNKNTTTKKAVKVAKETTKKVKNVDLSKVEHFLVPEHIVLSDKEKEVLFNKYNISIKELPKILASDPAIRHLGVKETDVIKILRKSPTAQEVVFYRGVINE